MDPRFRCRCKTQLWRGRTGAAFEKSSESPVWSMQGELVQPRQQRHRPDVVVAVVPAPCGKRLRLVHACAVEEQRVAVGAQMAAHGIAGAVDLVAEIERFAP